MIIFLSVDSGTPLGDVAISKRFCDVFNILALDLEVKEKPELQKFELNTILSD